MKVFAVRGQVKINISESNEFAEVEFYKRYIPAKTKDDEKVVALIFKQIQELRKQNINPKYVILAIKEWESVCAVISQESRILRPGDQVFGLEPIIIPFTDNFHHCLVVGSADDMAQMAWRLVNDEERMLKENDRL